MVEGGGASGAAFGGDTRRAPRKPPQAKSRDALRSLSIFFSFLCGDGVSTKAPPPPPANPRWSTSPGGGSAAFAMASCSWGEHWARHTATKARRSNQ